MKKNYQRPVVLVEEVMQEYAILAESVHTVSSNADFNENISAGHGEARSREANVWDE